MPERRSGRFHIPRPSMMPEVSPKGTYLLTTGAVIVGIIVLGLYGSRTDSKEVFGTFPVTIIPAEAYDYAPPLPTPTYGSELQVPLNSKEQAVRKLIEEGWLCVTIKKGDWLTKILRQEGVPGIDSGPYVVVHNDASRQDFPTYDQLPNVVYPKEEFCFKDENRQGNNGAMLSNHGDIFQATIRYQNSVYEASSRDIQASIKAKQGF